MIKKLIVPNDVWAANQSNGQFKMPVKLPSDTKVLFMAFNRNMEMEITLESAEFEDAQVQTLSLSDVKLP